MFHITCITYSWKSSNVSVRILSSAALCMYIYVQLSFLRKSHTSFRIPWASRASIFACRRVIMQWPRCSLASLHEYTNLYRVAFHSRFPIIILGDSDVGDGGEGGRGTGVETREPIREKGQDRNASSLQLEWKAALEALETRVYILWIFSTTRDLLSSCLDKVATRETRHGLLKHKQSTSLLSNADSRPIACRKHPMQASLNTTGEKRTLLLSSFHCVSPSSHFLSRFSFSSLSCPTPVLTIQPPTTDNFQPQVSGWYAVITGLAFLGRNETVKEYVYSRTP